MQTNNGTFQADKVIITVPLGVLKNEQIQFLPKLPEQKITAINHLKMSSLNKIGLLFDKIFWQKEIIRIGYNVNPKNAIVLFYNYAYFFKKPILLGAASGDAAVEIENNGADYFVTRAMQTLRELYGNNIPNPITTITTNWINDPFSKGSYSYIPVGASGADMDILAEPVNNQLFFAGEATYRAYHSTVQGAYLSGVREAKRILS